MANKSLMGLGMMIALLLVINNAAGSKSIGTLYKWKQMDYEYPTPQHRLAAIQNQEFIQENSIPLGIERWKDRVFVSTPRWKRGVPATLSWLPTQVESESAPLRPYPSWDWHNAANCTGFTAIFRMTIDHCGTMWVLDSGRVEAFETPRQLCPPALIAIDLNTDTVLARYPIPEEFVLENSLLSNVVVDSREASCKDAHIYIADTWRFGLIVFRASDQKFWRFTSFTFFPEPLMANLTLHGVNYVWTDGIFGMSLGKFENGDRPLYYHAMASSREFVVSTSVIRNMSRVGDSVYEFNLLGEDRGDNGQVTAAAVDRNGVMFFSLISRDSIGCWNTCLPYRNENLGIVARNSRTLVFPNDLRIDHEIPQRVWIISNRLPMYQFNLIDPNDYNYRIMFLDPVNAVKHGVCQC